MKLDGVTERARATSNLGFMALKTSDDGDLHGVYYNRHADIFKVL
jgi:hypothetical protein